MDVSAFILHPIHWQPCSRQPQNGLPSMGWVWDGAPRPGLTLHFGDEGPRCCQGLQRVEQWVFVDHLAQHPQRFAQALVGLRPLGLLGVCRRKGVNFCPCIQPTPGTALTPAVAQSHLGGILSSAVNFSFGRGLGTSSPFPPLLPAGRAILPNRWLSCAPGGLTPRHSPHPAPRARGSSVWAQGRLLAAPLGSAQHPIGMHRGQQPGPQLQVGKGFPLLPLSFPTPRSPQLGTAVFHGE